MLSLFVRVRIFNDFTLRLSKDRPVLALCWLRLALIRRPQRGDSTMVGLPLVNVAEYPVAHAPHLVPCECPFRHPEPLISSGCLVVWNEHPEGTKNICTSAPYFHIS